MLARVVGGCLQKQQRRDYTASESALQQAVIAETEKPPVGGFCLRRDATYSSGVFLPSLYVYRVVAAFLSSPLVSNWMVPVTPL